MSKHHHRHCVNCDAIVEHTKPSPDETRHPRLCEVCTQHAANGYRHLMGTTGVQFPCWLENCVG